MPKAIFGMKLVLYIGGTYPHIKNYMAIQRMCKSTEIEFEETNDYERINLYDKIIYLIDFVINFIFDDFFCSSHLCGVHGNRHFFEKGI